MTDFAKEAKRVKPEIEGLMASCDLSDASSEGKGKMKTVLEKILQVLMLAGLAYKETMKCDRMGVHPDNRFGTGVDPVQVHTLLWMIVQQGWAWLEVAGRAIAFAVSPKRAKEQRAFNENLVELSGGTLAPIGPDLRALTVAGSHTTQVLKAVNGQIKGMPEAFESQSSGLWDGNGFLDQKLIFEACPEMQKAVADGIEYIIVRAEAEEVRGRGAGERGRADTWGRRVDRR